jgi:ribosomal protein S18 acetylase RimI-like enzyme
MTVRSIDADEALLFARVSDPGASVGWVHRLWERGESRPAWCFIAEEAGTPVARLAYLSFPSAPDEVQLFALHLPRDDEYMRVGRPLLMESLCMMRGEGARTLECQFAIGAPHAAERSALCEMIGLPLAQRKERFLMEHGDPAPLPDAGLLWRSLVEVGEETFLAAMERVSIGGLDRLNGTVIAERGLPLFARDLLAILRALDDQPAWWELAYDRWGALVGLIVPQRFTPGDGAINYIGVVPEMRGRGYVDAMLLRGVGRLRENGVARIIGDTDSENIPMASALLRAGFAAMGERLVYHGTIAPILDRED